VLVRPPLILARPANPQGPSSARWPYCATSVELPATISKGRLFSTLPIQLRAFGVLFPRDRVGCSCHDIDAYLRSSQVRVTSVSRVMLSRLKNGAPGPASCAGLFSPYVDVREGDWTPQARACGLVSFIPFGDRGRISRVLRRAHNGPTWLHVGSCTRTKSRALASVFAETRERLSDSSSCDRRSVDGSRSVPTRTATVGPHIEAEDLHLTSRAGEIRTLGPRPCSCQAWPKDSDSPVVEALALRHAGHRQ